MLRHLQICADASVHVHPPLQKCRPCPQLSNVRRPRTVSIQSYQQQCPQCTLSVMD